MGRWLYVIAGVLAWTAWASGAIVPQIPFVFTNGLIRIEVVANASSAPLSFLLDSGAAVSVLNASTARRIGALGGERVVVKGVGAQTTGRWPVRLPASASCVALPALYLVTDLCELQETCAAPVDGLIGADFFHGKIVELDFASRVVRILPKVDKATAGERLPLKNRRGIWNVNAAINAVPEQSLRLDTGCATGVHWVNRSAARETSASVHSVGLAAFTAASGKCSVVIGPHRAIVAAAIHEEQMFAGEDGLLGTGFLSQFRRVTMDGRSSALFLSR